MAIGAFNIRVNFDSQNLVARLLRVCDYGHEWIRNIWWPASIHSQWKKRK